MDHIEVSADDGVAVITFERPPVNALTRQVLRDLSTVFNSFADDRTVSAAVFRTSGDRAFIAGQDLHEISAAVQDPDPSFLVDRGRVGVDKQDRVPAV